MSETTFEQLLRDKGGFRTRTVTQILPPRQFRGSDRASVTGRKPYDPNDIAGQVSDVFYNNAKALAKFVYSKIEERFKEVLARKGLTDKDRSAACNRRDSLMAEAKSILNEHRNQVVEAVLPLYTISAWPTDSEPAKADLHAEGFIVKNVFAMLCKTYAAWLPEFCSADQEEAAEETIARLSLIHREKLTSELRNFTFEFKRVVTPS